MEREREQLFPVKGGGRGEHAALSLSLSKVFDGTRPTSLELLLIGLCPALPALLCTFNFDILQFQEIILCYYSNLKIVAKSIGRL